MRSRRKFTREFKLDAVQRLRAGEPAGLVARSLEVSRQELYRLSRDVNKSGERAFSAVGQKRAEETRIAELERKIGQQVLEIDFLKRALQHVNNSAHNNMRWHRTAKAQSTCTQPFRFYSC